MADATAPQTTPSVPQPLVAENGYIYGIDGMLDQICGAIARQGKAEWLPVLQQDKALQTTIGAGIGRELAKPLWVLVFLFAGYIGYKLLVPRASIRANPWRSRRSRRSRRFAASLRA